MENLNKHKNLLDKEQSTKSVEDKIKAYDQIELKTSFLYKVLRALTSPFRAPFDAITGKKHRIKWESLLLHQKQNLKCLLLIRKLSCKRKFKT
jgi:hypothetical protein